MTDRNRENELTERTRVRLQQLIAEGGLTQHALALRLGTDQATMSRFRTGQMKHPPLDFLDQLCRIFDRTLSDVLAEEMPARPITAATGPVEVEVLENYRRLDPEAQHVIRRQLAMWASYAPPRAPVAPSSTRSPARVSARRVKAKHSPPRPRRNP